MTRDDSDLLWTPDTRSDCYHALRTQPGCGAPQTVTLCGLDWPSPAVYHTIEPLSQYRCAACESSRSESSRPTDHKPPAPSDEVGP